MSPEHGAEGRAQRVNYGLSHVFGIFRGLCQIFIKLDWRFNMARPLVEVEIEGRKLNAALDTGSRRSYIKSELTEQFPAVSVHPFEAKLGGETINLKEGRVVSGIVKDSLGRAYRFGNILFPVKDLGQEAGREVHVLFGAIILEDWGTVIDESITPPQVDYRILRKGELIEL